MSGSPATPQAAAGGSPSTSQPAFDVIEHVWIPLSDGVRLSARIWLPVGAREHPVPAILEYLPYRKDDGTLPHDAAVYPYFAEQGYAGVRVDIRGTGDSEGVLLGEYLASEQDDALEVLAWIAEQPWCTGACGMIGQSWGGFNGLQVAARRPPQLKAIVTIYSTDDRYSDDCHYMGGCLLGSDMLKWAESMHAYNALPPDPRIVGEGWRDAWLARLRDTPPFIGDWIAHPNRDEFWKQGSVCEDYSAIEAATLVVGGWTDPYTNAVGRLLENLTCFRRGIIGPWAHVPPQRGVPGPAIGFLQECVRWFDRWLKGIDTGVESDPMLRAYVMESVKPARFYAERAGQWVAGTWPPSATKTVEYSLGSDGRLFAAREGDASPPEGGQLSITGDQTCGVGAGVWCPNGAEDELPDDQAADDALSLMFTTLPLSDDMVVFGRPVAHLAVSSDEPVALVAVRLCDVAPTGESTLMSYGLLNLTHRDGDEHPRALRPGEVYQVEVPLGAIGQRVRQGHRLRLAISPTYWPHAWPSPKRAALTLHLGDGASRLTLPVRAGEAAGSPPAFAPAFEVDPKAHSVPSTAKRTRTVTRDEDGGSVTTIDRTHGSTMIAATDTVCAETAIERWYIRADDPLSARVECERELSISRPGWDVRVVTHAVQTCDEAAIRVETSLEAFDADERIFEHSERYWVDRTIGLQ